MSGSLTPLLHYLCVSWHQYISLAFLEEIYPAFCVASCMVSFVVKLADIKHKSSEAYLVKFKENLSCGFKIMDISFQKSRFFFKTNILKDFTLIKK